MLDVGTGTGVFAEAFAARGLAVVGIDPNDDFLHVARGLAPGAEFKQATAEALSYGDRSFEVVFLGHVLHETDDPAGALGEACRVGTARVVVLEWPYVQEEQGPPLEHRLTQQAIVEMAARVGLDAVETMKLGHMDFHRMSVEPTEPQGERVALLNNSPVATLGATVAALSRILGRWFPGMTWCL